MFVVALTNDGHGSDKRPRSGRSAEAVVSARNGPGQAVAERARGAGRAGVGELAVWRLEGAFGFVSDRSQPQLPGLPA